jgi:hypothetical protein
MDPMLAAGATRSIKAEMDAANAVVSEWQQRADTSRSLTEDEVLTALHSARGIVDLLGEADRGDRLDLYRALGVSLSYERIDATGRELVHARSQLRGGGGLIPRLAPTGSARIVEFVDL